MDIPHNISWSPSYLKTIIFLWPLEKLQNRFLFKEPFIINQSVWKCKLSSTIPAIKYDPTLYNYYKIWGTPPPSPFHEIMGEVSFTSISSQTKIGTSLLYHYKLYGVHQPHCLRCLIAPQY